MKKAYDSDRAKNLVPLLESISRELTERHAAIAKLERGLRSFPDSEAPNAEELDLRAELATQRRELRLAQKELEKLGCAVDENDPGCIRIPGADGKLERGFQWSWGELEPQPAGPDNH